MEKLAELRRKLGAAIDALGTDEVIADVKALEQRHLFVHNKKCSLAQGRTPISDYCIEYQNMSVQV